MLLILALSILTLSTSAQNPNDIFHPVQEKNAMISTADATATQVGLSILQKGGNAIDAAVAIGFTLAVTRPQAGNLGGGGFMLIRTAKGNTSSIDFRETAPSKASRDMFLDNKGNVIVNESLNTHLSSGTPGTVAGLILALEKYGTMPLSQLIAPAIKLAEDGFTVNDALASALMNYGQLLLDHPNSKAIFYKPDGRLYQKGDVLVQKDLANSLKSISECGRDAFYKGEIARQIAMEMQKHGGLISEKDLANYHAVERVPINGTYRGYNIFSMPSPSSGGIHVVQILNIIENFELASMGAGSADAIHVFTEAEKYAYADRSEYLGDPDFYNVPVEALTSKAYAKSIADQIDMNKARPSSEIKPGNLTPYESNQTTHFSVLDKDGNAVSVTYTLNAAFGSGIVAGNTGILMNDEMDDFSIKPGTPNKFGLIGGEANAIEPLKRPVSSMSPTIVVKDGKTWLITGSPGGSKIISIVVQILVNTIDFGMNIAEASSVPRSHHQWLPDQLMVEKGFSPDTLKLLEMKGYNITESPAMGSTQSIMVGSDGMRYGAADPRTIDDLAAGY